MATAKTNDEMVTRSIYIKKELYDRLQKAAGRAGASLVIGYLIEKWLKGEVSIGIEPEEFSKDAQSLNRAEEEASQ